MTVTRGTSNGNDRGNAETRRRRRAWLVSTWRADVDAYLFGEQEGGAVWIAVPLGTGVPACRCYRCGCLLVEETVSVDRIVPGFPHGEERVEKGSQVSIQPNDLIVNFARVRTEPVSDGIGRRERHREHVGRRAGA